MTPNTETAEALNVLEGLMRTVRDNPPPPHPHRALMRATHDSPEALLRLLNSDREALEWAVAMIWGFHGLVAVADQMQVSMVDGGVLVRAIRKSIERGN